MVAVVARLLISFRSFDFHWTWYLIRLDKTWCWWTSNWNLNLNAETLGVYPGGGILASHWHRMSRDSNGRCESVNLSAEVSILSYLWVNSFTFHHHLQCLQPVACGQYNFPDSSLSMCNIKSASLSLYEKLVEDSSENTTAVIRMAPESDKASSKSKDHWQIDGGFRLTRCKAWCKRCKEMPQEMQQNVKQDVTAW